jgi:hypothetical protein
VEDGDRLEIVNFVGGGAGRLSRPETVGETLRGQTAR